MKKRISTRAACLLIAAMILIGALTVSAINGSPYEILKNAVIDALFYDNFTIQAEFTIRVDGQLHTRARVNGYFDSVTSYGATYEEEPWRDDTVQRHAHYSCQYFSVSNVYTAADGTQWYSVRKAHSNTPEWVGHEIFGPAGRNSNQLRLAELLVDIVVGDLKNNMTISTQPSGHSRISGAITGSQLPEILRLLIDIVLEDERHLNPASFDADSRHVLDIPLASLSVDHVQGNADVDNHGNLVYLNAIGIATIVNILGDTHVVEVEGTIYFSDIGTTVVDSPFAGAAERFAQAFDARPDLSQWHFLHFTLDENGDVDLDSMTEWMPGRIRTTSTFSYPGRGH